LITLRRPLARRLLQREDDYLRYIGMLDALTRAASGSAWVPQTP
jgi:hypothetical protein